MAFLANNWLNVAGLLGTLIFGFLSVLFYLRSVKKPVPAYGVHPLRVRIVDPSHMPEHRLEVFHEGRSLTGQHVTAATVYFWNAGRAPIRSADVLKQFRITCGDEKVSILDIKTVKLTRDVCDLEFKQLAPNEAAINFSVLEYSDGVVLQLIFVGDPNCQITCEGACVGAKAPLTIRLAEFLNSSNLVGYVASLLLSVMVGGIACFTFWAALKTPENGLKAVAIIFTVLFLSGSIGFFIQGAQGFRRRFAIQKSSLAKLVQ